MNTRYRFVFYCSLLILLVASGLAARIGEAAPDFTATDSNGKSHHLADYKGNT